MIRVTENLASLRKSLATAAIAAGRPPDAVKLLAVSKKQPVEKILAAIEAGQRHFGENFVQEGLQKISQTEAYDLVWHFIGHLQSNKTRAVAENFDWVHTIDKLKLAERLSRQRPDTKRALNICLQVNVDDEPQKSGIDIKGLPELAAACAELPKLRLRGLMCLPAARSRDADQAAPFATLRKLADELRRNGIDTDTLSMGMSGDYHAAIREGATIVRIGTAVFGKRK